MDLRLILVLVTHCFSLDPIYYIMHFKTFAYFFKDYQPVSSQTVFASMRDSFREYHVYF